MLTVVQNSQKLAIKMHSPQDSVTYRCILTKKQPHDGVREKVYKKPYISYIYSLDQSDGPLKLDCYP